jgi:DNA-binding CsgD family transcriptional regulator
MVRNTGEPRRSEEQAMSRPATAPSTGPPARRVLGDLIPAPRLAAEDATPLGLDRPSLNARDREVLRHLADGWSTPQIAAAMSITSNTARTRIRRVQRKLAAPEREQAVAEGRELGLL